MLSDACKSLMMTRPKPAFGRHGLGLDLKVSLCRLARFGGPQLTCFGQKNVTSLLGGPNRPPLVQKRNVINRGPKLTSFGPKNVRPLTGGPTDLF